MMPATPLVKAVLHLSCVLTVLWVLNSSASAQTCVQPPAGLMGWWPLDETSGTTATDLVSGNDGTYVGDPTPVTGMVAGALSFNEGNGDEIFVRSTFPFHQPGDATLEFWLNTPATGHQSVFWTRGDAEDANRFHIFINEDSTFGFDYRPPSGEFHGLVSGVSIPRNTWTHLAIARTGDDYNLYVNGVLAASATDTSPDLPTAADWQIAGQGQIDFRYNGSLDEVSLYNRALSAAEIQAIFQAGSAGKCKEAGGGGVGGTVTGLQPALIVCENLSTSQTAVIWEQQTSWNCETAGLEVTPDDIIRITLVGGAQ